MRVYMSVANATASVHGYDPAANVWTPSASLQVARQYAGAAEVDGVVYVIGGDVPEYGGAYPEPSAAVEAMQL